MNTQDNQTPKKMRFFAKKRKNWKRRSIRGLIGLLMFILVSWGYQTIATASDAHTYPPSGTLIDVGGYRLHISCMGKGSPTVIMDAGLGVSSLVWSRVQPNAAHFTRVCSYDRAGLGWSDPGLTSQTSQKIVTDLHTLLAHAHITGPYILVGHSFGGLNMRLYASEYQQDVAGMVLVDAPNDEQPLQVSPVTHQIVNICHVLAQIGVMRLAGLVGLFPDDMSTYDTSVLSTAKALMVLPKYFTATYKEQAGYAISTAQVRAHKRSLGNLPLIVLTAGRPDAMGQAQLHKEQIQQEILAHFLSSNSKQIIANQSGHVIQFSQPNLVIDSIAQIVYAAQHGSNLPA